MDWYVACLHLHFKLQVYDHFLTRSSYLVLFLLLVLPITEASYKEISITLVPRDCIDPRTDANFTCGVDTSVDPNRLLAEQSARYVFDVIDNTKDESKPHRTEVFDVITFSQSGAPQQITDTEKYEGQTGLFSLFLVPSMHQCNAQTFEDSATKGTGYYPVFVGVTNVINETAILNQFIADAPTLKVHFQPHEELPKLCGSFTPMLPINSVVAASKRNSLVQVFNFLYNEERVTTKFTPSSINNCRTVEETEKSLSKYFNSEGASFEKSETEVKETDGFLKVDLKRETTEKTSVVFIETIDQTADETDFVLFKGPAVFSESSKTTSFYLRLKYDSDTANETFALNIRKEKNRKKRGLTSFLVRIVGEPFLQRYLPTCAYKYVIAIVTTPSWVESKHDWHFAFLTPDNDFRTPHAVISRLPDSDEKGELEQEIQASTVDLATWASSVEALSAEDEKTQNFRLVFTTFEMISQALVLDEPTYPFMDEQEENLRINEMINHYEKDTTINQGASCDKTALSLTHTYLKDLKVVGIYMEEGVWIPAKDALDFITSYLEAGKVVRVELTVRGTACGNHLFTMWKLGNTLSIVHGWQDQFYAKLKQHNSMTEALTYLRKMLWPPVRKWSPGDMGQHPQTAQQLTGVFLSIDNKKEAFDNFFGDTVEGLNLLFVDEAKKDGSDQIFEVKYIISGFPSTIVPTKDQACERSKALEKRGDDMPKTSELCPVLPAPTGGA